MMNANSQPTLIPSTMRALQLDADGLRLVRNLPVPQLAPGEALLRVRLAGVCATDFELIRGYKGGFKGILGHEFVGEVVAAPAEPAWLGRRVVGEINVGCGECFLCRRGLDKHCRQRTSLGIIGRNGAFADYTTLPIANLHEVPAGLADELAVFTEPLAAAFEMLEQVPILPGQRVYVLGDGRLGLLCSLVLARTGCDLTVIGRHPAKLALLAGRGLHTVLATAENLAALGRTPADIVVEATGARDGFADALRLLRPLGTLLLKSTYADTLPSFDLSQLVVDEMTIVGSRCGPFPVALAALAGDEFDLRALIAGDYPLDDGLAAIALAGQKGILKVLIRP